MPKDKDDLTAFDKKKSQYEEVENYDKKNKKEENNDSNNEFTDSEDESIDENYDEDTLNIIEKKMIEYVDNGINLCEYINIKKIDAFLNKLGV